MSQHLFIKYHFKQILTLGIISILIVGLQVSIEDGYLTNKKDSEVKGAAIISNQGIFRETVLAYQTNIKNIITDYLQVRSTFNGPHQKWLFLINNTKYQLLNIEVPNEYKELHLALITILNKEKEAVTVADKNEINKININWEKILNQYFWLNN